MRIFQNFVRIAHCASISARFSQAPVKVSRVKAVRKRAMEGSLNPTLSWKPNQGAEQGTGFPVQMLPARIKFNGNGAGGCAATELGRCEEKVLEEETLRAFQWNQTCAPNLPNFSCPDSDSEGLERFVSRTRALL